MSENETRIGDKAFTKYFIKPVDAFLAMSQSVLNDIDLFDTKKPRVLSPHPLFDNFGSILPRDQALEKLGLDPSKQYMLFFGLVRKYKGLDLLLEAFSDISFRTKNIHMET